MKRIITALSLVACATVALANDGYRLNAGESDADLTVKVQLGSAGENTYYINQAGQPDLHQPQVG
jgi:hypothetical protein